MLRGQNKSFLNLLYKLLPITLHKVKTDTTAFHRFLGKGSIILNDATDEVWLTTERGFPSHTLTTVSKIFIGGTGTIITPDTEVFDISANEATGKVLTLANTPFGKVYLFQNGGRKDNFTASGVSTTLNFPVFADDEIIIDYSYTT